MNCCPVCGHSPSRLPFAVTVLAVLVVASIGLGVFNLWRDSQIEDRVAHIPQAQINKFSLGPYAVMKIYEDGWVAREAEKMIEPVKEKNGGKKK
jgi:hypothetical protein